MRDGFLDRTIEVGGGSRTTPLALSGTSARTDYVAIGAYL
jgi:hypothetical protein